MAITDELTATYDLLKEYLECVDQDTHPTNPVPCDAEALFGSSETDGPTPATTPAPTPAPTPSPSPSPSPSPTECEDTYPPSQTEEACATTTMARFTKQCFRRPTYVSSYMHLVDGLSVTACADLCLSRFSCRSFTHRDSNGRCQLYAKPCKDVRRAHTHTLPWTSLPTFLAWARMSR